MGLDANGLNTVFQALIVSKVLYVLPAIMGFYCQSEIDAINSVFLKAYRWGLVATALNIQNLADSADERLFHSVQYNPKHCLHQLLPEPKHLEYDLRPRGHPYPTPSSKSEQFRSTFVARMLIQNV